MSSHEYDNPDEPGIYWASFDGDAVLAKWDGEMWTFRVEGVSLSTDSLEWDTAEIPEPHEIEGGV